MSLSINWRFRTEFGLRKGHQLLQRSKPLALFIAIMLGSVLAPAAAGQATPEASPEASSAQHYVAGERARLLELSPDGTMVAGINDDDLLCTFAVPSGDEIACTDVVDKDISVDFESIAWAPDSSTFTFSEPAFAYFIDSDIWRFDAQSGELTNLTDDGYAGKVPLFGEDLTDKTVYLDVSPAWSPDGKTIAFSRSVIEPGSENQPSELWMLDVATGDAVKIVTVDPEQMGILYYGLLWSPDGKTIYATYSYLDPGNPDSGVYAIDPATGDATQIAGPNPDFDDDTPTVTTISPDGGTLVVSYPAFLASSSMTGSGGYALLSIADGTVARVDPPVDTDPDMAFAIAPAFTADGKSLIYPVVRLSAPGGLVIARDLASGSETVIATLPDGALPVATARNQSLGIGANGIALVMVNPFEAYLVPVTGEQSQLRSGHIEITLPTPEPVG